MSETTLVTSQSATVLWHGEHRVDFDCDTDFLDGLLDYPAYFAHPGVVSIVCS
jgi:hypothetical protein